MTWALVADPNRGVQSGPPQPPMNVVNQTAKSTTEENLRTLQLWNTDFVKRVEALLKE